VLGCNPVTPTFFYYAKHNISFLIPFLCFMRKLLLLLVTLITFTNVSYASFPVVEKVSNQTTGSNGSLLEMGVPTPLIIWTIVVFLLLVFLSQYSRTRLTNTFKYFQIFGWRVKVRAVQGPWWLILSSFVLMVVAALLTVIWMWIGLGCIIGYC
jgi:hypothetical protein